VAGAVPGQEADGRREVGGLGVAAEGDLLAELLEPFLVQDLAVALDEGGPGGDGIY